ncbi:MAG: DUF433 domain-containing protein [Nanoarchaeota archaeon]
MSSIIINSKIFGGKPIIKGTRISVEFILEMLASGMSPLEILKEYPHLKKSDILDVLTYAVHRVKQEEVYSTN